MKSINCLRSCIFFLLLFLGMTLKTVNAQTPSGIVVTGSAPTIVKVGEPLNIRLSTAIDNEPTVNQECTIDGPEWKWTASGTGASISPSVSPDDTESTMLSVTFPTAGTYTFGASVNAKFSSNCSSTPINVGGSKSFTVKAVSASFDQSLIKTGYLKSGVYMTAAKTVNLSVNPASETNNVELEAVGSTAEIRNIVKSPGLGKITFQVWGISASTNKNGDTTIIARYPGVDPSLTESKVAVVIPAAIMYPNVESTVYPDPEGEYSQLSTTVTGYNRLLDATTSPALPGTPSGRVVPATTYQYGLTMTVLDQFGDILDAVYAGARITEKNGIPINRVLSSSGTYIDVVGDLAYMEDAAHEVVTYQIGSAEAIAWPSQPLLPMILGSDSQNIAVEVGGHSLNPAVQRTIRTIPPNTVRITWLK